MEQTAQKKAENIMKTAQGNTLDVYYTLYCECIRPSEKPWEVLEFILQSGFQTGTDDAPASIIKEGNRDKIRQSYYKLLREIVRVQMNNDIPVEEFYKNIYEQVFNSTLFPKEDAERAVLLWLLAERIPEIPYYQAIDPLKLTNEEYREAIMRVFQELQQAAHMLNRSFGSRTEETSQLVRIADGIEDKTDQIVYWSAVISMLGRGNTLKQEKKPHT